MAASVYKGFYRFVLISLLSLIFLGGTSLHGQTITQDTTTEEKETVIQTQTFKRDLSKGWIEGAEVWNVPFILPNTNRTNLKMRLNILFPEQLPDTVYLYFEGIAWRVSVELDGKFLGMHEDPFKPWVIPIVREWLSESVHTLSVHLTRGDDFALYPSQFLGIFRPVYLLDKESLADHQQKIMQEARMADTICVYAPYFPETQYVFDQKMARKDLTQIGKLGMRYVYFPFSPSRELQKLCKEVGMIRIKRLPPNSHICWYRVYPFEARSFPYSYEFWLDENNEASRHYACYYQIDGNSPVKEEGRSSFLLIFLILFPIMGALIIRIVHPSFWESLGAILIYPKLFLEGANDATYTGAGAMLILIIIKVFALAIMLSFFIFHVNLENRWDFLNVLTESSLGTYIFYGKSTSLGIIFLRSLWIIGLWYVFQQILFRMLASSFRIFGLVSNLMQLDLVSSYPLVILLPIPMAFVFFSSYQYEFSILLIQLGLYLIYLIRSAYVMYMGLGRIYGISSGVKILYICVLKILPNAIWL